MNASTNIFIIPLLLLTFALAAETLAAGGTISHDIQVRIEPAQGKIRALDRIRLPANANAGKGFEFLLHAGLRPRTETPGAGLRFLGRVNGAVPLERYRLIPPAGERDVTLSYAGTIRHELRTLAEGVGKERQQTPGTVSDDGVFLDSRSAWYPRFDGAFVRFTLDIDLPAGWLAVSQGRGPEIESRDGRTRVRWVATQPQDDIYLIGGRFRLYRHPTAFGEAQVYLRSEDSQLAMRYLRPTEKYLELYSRLIGPYPYEKFALVENFWDTGYGMPSFTLLGPSVIRLPFIVHSSYPHEIVHNWWGNSVYLDYQSGNWSEGLTTYMADHLLQEQRGRGVEYRRNALQRYEDFVRAEKDFPLSRFRSRHGAVSQSVGYDKGLMLFHMLRRELGDPLFLEGLRVFYKRNRFRVAGFADLQDAFEAVSGRDLGPFFRQWTERAGAPSLAVEAVRVTEIPDGYRVTARIRQTQDAAPYQLQIPIALHLAGGGPAMETDLKTDDRLTDLQLEVSERPERLDIDPRFDLFRRLAAGEVPPTLSALLGQDKALIVLPSDAPSALSGGYRSLAERWARGRSGLEVTWDKDLAELPKNQPVWMLGWSNRFRADFARSLAEWDASITEDGIRIHGDVYPRNQFSVALVTGQEGAKPLAWIGAHTAEALSGLARKLPHYGKYSYLAFSGPAPTNRLKGQWPVSRSPLKVLLGEGAVNAELAPRPSLSVLVETGRE